MRAALVIRSLKAFRPHLSLHSRQSCEAGRLHHIFSLRALWRQRFAAAALLEQRCTEPVRKERLRKLFTISLSPPSQQPNGNNATTGFFSNNATIGFFSVDCRGILPTECLSLLKMEGGMGTGSTEETLKTSGEGATGQEEGKEGLRKEQEKKKKKQEEEEEEKIRVKEQEMEDKIGPAPEKPLAGDCCGQGCEVCVWDTYWDELDKYKKLLKAAEGESGK